MSGYRRNLMGAEASKPKGPKYLIFEPLVDDFSFEFPYDLYYSTDGVDWLLLESATESPYFSKDERIYLKAELVPEPGYGIGSFSIYGKCNLSGNCMSLLYGDNAEGKTTAPDSAFSYLFEDCSTIIDASSLLLPATILEDGCYEYMFTGCSGLIFAPKIHATILARGCCHMMFYGCTNLINAPVLLATTLVDDCYSNMFFDCTKLNYIKMLATDISARRCLGYWVYNVASRGTFVKNKDATWDVVGESGVPVDWTVVNAVTMNTNSLIEFTIINTIDSTTTKYKAEEGMTWEEWCELEYNIGRYKVIDGTICINKTAGSLKENNGVTKVKPSDIIQENVIYYYNDSGTEPA